MPLPPEELERIKAGLDKAQADINSMEDVVSDLRASGIDALPQEERLRELRQEYNRMRLFYERQAKRSESAE